MPPEKLFSNSNTKEPAVLAFIDLIRENRIIWDTSDPDHHIKEKWSMVWSKVARASGYNRNDRARFHWQRLKEKFRNVWNHQAKHPNAVTAWPYFEEMKFLKEGLNNKSYAMDSEDEDLNSTVPLTRSKRKRSPDADETSNEDSDEESSKIDGDYMFLVSLLPTFQKLDPMCKMHLRMKIQGLLVQEIHKQLNQSTNSPEAEKEEQVEESVN